MLYGKLDTFSAAQCGHEGVATALDFAKTYDMNAFTPGRIEVSGDETVFINANEYNTKEESDCRYEAHRRYIDIHLMVEGVERIDSADVSGLTMDEYSDEGDYALGDGEAETTVVLKPGMFAIYFPEDGHKPGIAIYGAVHVKKLVFKVLV